MDVINEEEKQFLKTLSRGRRMFERTLTKLQSDVIPGNDDEFVIGTCGAVMSILGVVLLLMQSCLLSENNKF